MKTQKILDSDKHRPWILPSDKWKYYQEWNKVVFLHWAVDYDELKKIIPKDLVLDLFDSKAWVSLVAFNMDRISPRYLTSFPPISNFKEINIRTYVRYKEKPGVYFLNIEASKKTSALLSKTISKLPYQYSKIRHGNGYYNSFNNHSKDILNLEYSIGPALKEKTNLDRWLTERYALFQDDNDTINEFEIHHIEWPLNQIFVSNLNIKYPRFEKFFINEPILSHFSDGVQVLAWSKKNSNT